MRRSLPPLALVLALFAASGAALPASAADVEWAFAAGVFDTGGASLLAEAGVEARAPAFRLFRGYTFALVPSLGVTANSEGGAWLWSSLRFDWEIGERWVVTPFSGIGVYEQGEGKDLGGTIEFRSGLEVSRRLAGGGRFGAAFYHLSNADIYDDNPGSNSFVLVWSPGR